jgi:dTDP-4-dehydrorhamnose 3,5-epimerase
VVRGAIQLVEVDLRRRSPTFGQHIELEVSDVNGRIVWIPPGFANGFCVLSDVADVVYKCTAIYNADGEASLNPLDAKLGIHWMADRLVLSERDRNAPGLLELEPFFE